MRFLKSTKECPEKLNEISLSFSLVSTVSSVVSINFRDNLPFNSEEIFKSFSYLSLMNHDHVLFRRTGPIPNVMTQLSTTGLVLILLGEFLAFLDQLFDALRNNAFLKKALSL